MKVLELTQGQVSLVDDEDYEYLSQWNWHAWRNNSSKGDDRQNFYAVRFEYATQKTFYMHREIMNTPKNLICDHINHNTLDNQKHNLRSATPSQNGINRKGANRTNLLGERCISHIGKGFRVIITLNRSVVFRKTFRTLDVAIAERDKAIRKFHGEFSGL